MSVPASCVGLMRMSYYKENFHNEKLKMMKKDKMGCPLELQIPASFS
jgi:hypothetical protein